MLFVLGLVFLSAEVAVVARMPSGKVPIRLSSDVPIMMQHLHEVDRGSVKHALIKGLLGYALNLDLGLFTDLDQPVAMVCRNS